LMDIWDKLEEFFKEKLIYWPFHPLKIQFLEKYRRYKNFTLWRKRAKKYLLMS
jgi:hypothetical protein